MFVNVLFGVYVWYGDVFELGVGLVFDGVVL